MRFLRLKNRLLARVFTLFPSLAERWGRGLSRTGGEIPWAEPERPLRDARIGVVTTGGVHLTTQAPFDMGDPDGDPSYRAVPLETPPSGWTITHDYYNHAAADRDVNLVFPVDRLRELVEREAIGSLHPVGYSFMGHIDGPHVATLLEETAPRVADELLRGEVDYALLVPA